MLSQDDSRFDSKYDWIQRVNREKAAEEAAYEARLKEESKPRSAKHRRRRTVDVPPGDKEQQLPQLRKAREGASNIKRRDQPEAETDAKVHAEEDANSTAEKEDPFDPSSLAYWDNPQIHYAAYGNGALVENPFAIDDEPQESC